MELDLYHINTNSPITKVIAGPMYMNLYHLTILIFDNTFSEITKKHLLESTQIYILRLIVFLILILINKK